MLISFWYYLYLSSRLRLSERERLLYRFQVSILEYFVFSFSSPKWLIFNFVWMLTFYNMNFLSFFTQLKGSSLKTFEFLHWHITYFDLLSMSITSINMTRLCMFAIRTCRFVGIRNCLCYKVSMSCNSNYIVVNYYTPAGSRFLSVELMCPID